MATTKQCLKSWSWQSFSNIDKKLYVAIQQLDGFDSQIQVGNLMLLLTDQKSNNNYGHSQSRKRPFSFKNLVLSG